jgi:ssRNA-specific RNase YbeY (16S rRNA maturation enzyme)
MRGEIKDSTLPVVSIRQPLYPIEYMLRSCYKQPNEITIHFVSRRCVETIAVTTSDTTDETNTISFEVRISTISPVQRQITVDLRFAIGYFIFNQHTLIESSWSEDRESI